MKTIIDEDGFASYGSELFSKKESIHLFENLLHEIQWQPEKLIMFGKEITMKRQVSFYGDPNIHYTYSKQRKSAIPWNRSLLAIKHRIEEVTSEKFNACLVNLYPSGEEGMGWHRDSEKELRNNGTIASISLGAERWFEFKRDLDNFRIKMLLENGSLLLMQGELQKKWKHALPKDKKISTARINLTFRQITQIG